MAHPSDSQGRAPAKTARKTKSVLQIARRVSATIGTEFFRSMVQHLSEALAADCVYLGEFVGGPVERVRTLAACVDGQGDRSFEYPLAGSAAADVALNKPCLCRTGAQERFPADEILPQLHAEALVGVPLLNAKGQALGVLMAVYRRPIPSFRIPKSMLDIFAPRAAAELSHKQSEEQLRESEQRHLAFIAANPDGLWRVEFEHPIPVNLPESEQVDRIGLSGYIAECNDSLARFLGCDKAGELIGSRLYDIEALHSDFSIREATLALVRASYRPTTVETRPLDRNNKRHYMLRSQWGIVEDGMLQRIWGTTRDISELRKSELALNASEQRMVDLLETVHLVVVMLDLDGSIAFCNDYLLQLTGWKSAEIQGKNWFDLMIPPDEQNALRTAFESAKEGASPPVHVESTLLGADGHRWWIAWDCAVLGDSEGKIGAVVNVGRDLTEYKELESQFRQAQKLESIGRLASGVAHDFNNLLTVILGYSGALLARRELTDPDHIAIREIKKAAEKGADLAYQLLAFSRRQALRPTTLDLNTLVADDQRMLRRLIGENIELVTDLDPSLGIVRADAGHIHQVLLNLTVNARDAMPKGGRLTISSSNVNINGLKFPLLPCLPSGPYVRLTVADTGVGISAEVRAHLFEPFFTTKAPGCGTGLGLSTVYGIVRQSGGHITVESEPGWGTTFSILLPRIEQAPSLEPSGKPALPALKGGTETILLVEDQNEVRVLTAKILRELGYNVWEADGPAQAMELAKYSSVPVRLILTDVVMPTMSGVELANRVKQAHHEIKVLFMSGYPTGLPLGEDPLLSEAYIQKPFTPEALGWKVREILDRD
jgi:two-component system cell cycle sensor histidine kinase/response regulator CckA